MALMSFRCPACGKHGWEGAMRSLVLALLLSVARPALADDLNAKVAGLVAEWTRCTNEAADIFAPQPEPIETLLVGIFAACAKQERALTQNYYEVTGGDEDEFGRKLRNRAAPALTARILVARRIGGTH